MFLFYQLELGRLDRVCQWRTSGDDWNKIFWATLTSNGSPNATGPLSCLSVMLVCCGQMVGWIKMPLGTEAGLGPGHIVLDGDPAPPTEKGTAAPHFSAHVSLAKRLDGQDTT